MNSHPWHQTVATSETTLQTNSDLISVTPHFLNTASYLPAPPSSPQATVIAQQFDQDILGDLGNAWNAFIESGQVWALIIGLVIGYMIRGLTAY